MQQDQALVTAERRIMHGAGQGTRPLSGALVLVIGFALLIAAGTILLLLPFSTASGEMAPLSVALFTATSAVCVTGLAVVDTGTYWSGFGQTVIMLLIEVGGIGFGAAATLLFWLLGRNISLSERVMLREIVPGVPMHRIARVSLQILGVSLAIQGVGALLLFLSWSGKFPIEEAAFMAVFHAISAFCNAGFDVFGRIGQPDLSMGAFRDDPSIVLPIALLVVIGGLGFPVIGEIAARRPKKRAPRRDEILSGRAIRPPLSLNARLVLTAHLGLLAIGFIAFWLIEFANPLTLGGQDIGQQALDALNTSVYPRSAGFLIFPLLDLRPTSLFLLLILMFIGGASAGTGGGVKVNTIATLLASVAATLAGRPRPALFKRTLSQESISKSLAIVVVSVFVLAGATLILSLTHPDIPVERLLFEVVSAFSTVGMSLGVTTQLSEVGRLIIELIMFAGRLGPLTLVVLLSARERAPRVTYAEEPVLIG